MIGKPFVAASASGEGEVTDAQRAQARAIIDAPQLSREQKRSMIGAILAGQTVDISRIHAAMPGFDVGGSDPRANASRPHRSGTSEHHPMPGW